MQPRDRAEFLKILNGLAAVKPAAKLTPEALDVWWSAMQGWAIEDFRAAAAKLALDVEFMPNPYHFAQLRKAASGRNADAAWMELMQSHGGCSDPIGVQALRSIGGWRVVGFVEIERLPWLKERFREAYENFAESADAAGAVPSLAGSRRPALKGPQPISALLGLPVTEDVQ